MKKHIFFRKKELSAFPLSLLSIAIASATYAQEESEQAKVNLDIANPAEEVLVLGRLQDSAQDLVMERMEFENVVDLIGAEQISRLGDSTAAAALKRVPGITLVDGKFIYVRGLGERYSSSLLNGASVPSPDLTRNVLPLDIFPSSIIESVAVQKGFSANMPAAFGGGNIDIRTKGIPSSFVFDFETSFGIHSDSDEGLSYKGGTDDKYGEDDGTRALSNAIDSGLRTYYGSLDSPEGSLEPVAIEETFRRNGQPISFEEAEAINAQIATSVYRDLDIEEEDSSLQDGDIGLSVGSTFDLGNDFKFGAIASLDYERSTRTKDTIQRTYDSPDEEFRDRHRTTESVGITGSLNFGLRWGEEHEVASKNIFLRNTDDEVSITDIFNTTSPFSSGQGSRDYDYRFEERELEIYQVTGSHELGFETREKLGLGDSLFNDIQITWFYSDATATTDIPSETNIQANISRDLETNEIRGSQLTQGLRMLDLRYTELEDTVESSGFEVKLPMSFGKWEIELSGGGKYDKKARSYSQLDLSIGSSTSAAQETLRVGPENISSAISDAYLTNPDYNYRISYQSGLSRSYLAATTTDAFFGQADFSWNETIRIALGARYEEYKQFSAPWQPYRLNGNTLRVDLSDSSENEYPDGSFYQDDIYPSVAITYTLQDFWADDFNLRFAASETVVRPDLREVSDSSYRDPLTDIVVNGNPDAIPSDIKNYDLRAEWFFGSGDNLTVSLFYKDIENPLEYFQQTGAEDSITASIENSESGKSQGIEVEWLKGFEFLGETASQFFLSGNVTIADSEIKVGDELLVSVTNRERELRGAADYVANLQVGFDSNDNKHSATLIYNLTGERLFTAGVGDQPDSYEQAFTALDLSYSYYVTEQFTVKLKARNLLDEKIEIKQGDVNIFEESVGTSYSLGFKYSY